MNNPEEMRTMLQGKTIAVIGLSDNPQKPSHYVSLYMQQQGYTIYPVNPAIETVLGQRSYPSLTDLPIKPEIVNVFRLPHFIPAIVDEMLTLNLTNLWIQQGIVNEAAALKAEAAGIHVVMDRCIMIEHRRR